MHISKCMGIHSKPVVGLDIDGTLGDYHAHFLKFAEQWYGRKFPKADAINPGLPLYKFMGTSKEQYRKCKLAFRQGGMKRSMPAYPGVRELTVSVRSLGINIWICTSRPYNQLGNIEPDTQHWLKRNGIQYDAFVWGQHKYRDLIKSVGVDNVVCVIDDLPEMCNQAYALGLRTYMRDQPYNRHIDNYLRIFNMDQAENMIRQTHRIWKTYGYQ